MRRGVVRVERRHPPPLPLRVGHALEHAVGALVGLGPGLTPVGDDIVAGALVALGAVGGSRQRDRLAAAVATGDNDAYTAADLLLAPRSAQ